MFELDPDKPDVPGIARILSLFGVLSLIASVSCMLLAFSGYDWADETTMLMGAIGAFLLALLFVGQAKTLELLAVVSARVKSRFAMEALAKSAAISGGAKPIPVAPRTGPKERVIHISDQEAREQGVTPIVNR